MQIHYKNATIRKLCTDVPFAERRLGTAMVEILHQRLDQIQSVDSVEDLIRFHMGRCHPLKGNRKGQYAMDLTHPQRLIFVKVENTIHIVNIIEITDYHNE